VSVKIKTATRKEFIELCRTSPERAANILLSMAAALAPLEERVAQFEEQLKQDSHNGHKPQSSATTNETQLAAALVVVFDRNRRIRNRTCGGVGGRRG